MADNDPSSDSNKADRDKIAQMVLWIAGGGIGVLATISLLAAWFKADDTDRSVQLVFNSLLPLLGTWVGTVLAFYFSRDNFEAATQSTQKLLGSIDDRLRNTLIKDVLIPVGSIIGVTIVAGQNPSSVKIADMKALLSKKVSRIPVFDDRRAVLYVLHESLLFKFIAEKGLQIPAPPPVPPATAPGPATSATLADLLKDPDMKNEAMIFALTHDGGTLADAKRDMDAVDGAQDVFVTATGKAGEPVLGWITNADIAKKTRL